MWGLQNIRMWDLWTSSKRERGAGKFQPERLWALCFGCIGGSSSSRMLEIAIDGTALTTNFGASARGTVH